MSSIDSANHIDSRGLPYACPFFKSSPNVWLDHKTCISYQDHKLKSNVLRHHILDTHRKWNKKFKSSDSHYVDPRFFDELTQWLDNGGRKQDDHKIWMHVCGMIEDTRGESFSRQDPYWTVSWLHAVLGSMLPLEAQKAYYNIGMTPTSSAELSEMRRKIHTMENMLSNIHQHITNLETMQNSEDFSFSSHQHEFSQETQETGTMFPTQHDQIPSSLDFEMSGIRMGPAEDIHSSLDEMTHLPLTTRPNVHDQGCSAAGPPSVYSSHSAPFEGFTPGQGNTGAQTHCISNRAISAPTRPPSSMHYSY